jgi:CysZ protein
MSGNPFIGAAYLLQGFNLITQPQVRRFVVIPFIINTLLFGLLIWYGVSHFNLFMDWLLPEGLNWLRWLIWPLFAIGALLVLFYAFTMVANIVGAPFNGLLAEAVERHLRGAHSLPSGSWSAIIADVGPALFSELKKTTYFLARAIPLLVLFVIPVINIAAPFLWMAFSAWMLALEYADYPMGNHGLRFPQQRSRLKEKRLLVLGFGGATLFLTLIPFINFFIMPTAVAGATVMWVKEFRKNNEAASGGTGKPHG